MYRFFTSLIFVIFMSGCSTIFSTSDMDIDDNSEYSIEDKEPTNMLEEVVLVEPAEIPKKVLLPTKPRQRPEKSTIVAYAVENITEDESDPLLDYGPSINEDMIEESVIIETPEIIEKDLLPIRPRQNPYPIDLDNTPLLANSYNAVSPLNTTKRYLYNASYNAPYNDMDIYHSPNKFYRTGDPINTGEKISSSTVIENINALPSDIAQELICLSLNIYHEARGSLQQDQISTAFVALNRTKSIIFPDTVCNVVWQYYTTRKGKYVAQFSWTRDGAPDKPRTQSSWIVAQKLAYIAYFGGTPDPTSGRLNYYAHKIVHPSWAWRAKNKIVIGAHTYLTATKHTYIVARNNTN